MKSRDRKTPKKPIFDPKFLAALGLAAASPLLLGVYGWNHAATQNAVGEGLANLDTAVIGDISQKSLGFTKTITDSTSILNEAIKNTVRQEAVSATQLSVADKRAKQIEVAALEAQLISNDMIDVQLDYGAKTGQGHNVCQVLSENKQLDAAFTTATTQAKTKVTQLDNGPGQLVQSQEEALRARDEVHAKFCSAEEKAAGRCDVVSQVAGADSNANVLLVSSKPGTVVSQAKAAVRQNILGKPDLAVPTSVGQTVTGQAYLSQLNRKTALSAFPAYSLAYLDSMSTVRPDLKTKEGIEQSPNDVLFNTVTRYYGGADADEWQKSMIAQQPRGMLVELAKMEGLGAWMDHQEFLANQRLEGNIAAMTLTTALPMEDALDRQKQALIKRNIKGNY